MPVVQVDWSTIQAKRGDVTDLYFLTHRQASLLLSLSEQLTWRKTFRAFGYDFSDWDNVQLEVADLQRYLAMPVDLVQLVGYIDEVEDLLRAMQTIGITPCCDTLAPISEKKTTDEDYPTTPPAEWGDGEPIADSDDWKELVCGVAHIYVDILKETANELEQLVLAGGLVVGAIAGALALLAGAGIILAIGYGAAAGITTGLIEGIIIGVFGDSEQDLEDDRAAIVCAIVHGGATQLSDAIQTAVSGLAWTLWFQFIDYESAWATMVDGYNINGALGVNRSTDCECGDPGELIPDPGMNSPTADWTSLAPYTWGGDDEGRFYPDQTFPVDYVKLYSGSFVFPFGAPSNDCDVVFRLYTRIDHIGTWYCRVRNYDTQEIVYTQSVQDLGDFDSWEDIVVPGLCTLVKGTEYYAQIKIDAGDGYAHFVSGLSIKPVGS